MAGENEAAQQSQRVLFNVDIHDDGVYLTVQAPTEPGGNIVEAAVFEELKRQHVETYDRGLVLATMRERTGQAVKIAEPPQPPVEPEIRVLVSRDRMEAVLQVVLQKNSLPLTMEMLERKIAASGVAYGIDRDALERLCRLPGQEVVFARGLRPVDGENASIQYLVEMEHTAKPQEQADGRVDFKNLNLFTFVQAGQVLAEKTPPTPGTPGTDVLGNEVAAKPGRDLLMPAGKNVAIDEQRLVATAAGRIDLQNNKLHVLTVIEVKEDVDLSTGNIEFTGDVIVRGSVQQGMTVKAAGNVEIFGTISGGTVEGRNVLVKMGIQGMHSGYVKAVDTVVTQFIENATVHAGGEVLVGEVVLHSKVTAGRRIVVDGRRGIIAGGSIGAGEEIRAKNAGTQMATATELEVGVNPLLREEYQQLRRDLKPKEISLDQTQKALTILRAMDQSQMPPDKREMLLKLTKAQFHLTGQLEKMKQRLIEIERDLEQMKDGRIKIQDTVYPGVKITIGNGIRQIREPMKFASFYLEAGEIKAGTYS